MSAINYLPPFANSLIMHVLTNAEKLIPLRDAASLAESRRLAGMRMVTGTTSPSTRYERISVSPASCSIKSEYVIASHAFKPQYKCINYTPAWEQRKLGELVVIERGGSPRPIDEYITDDTNGLNWVKIGDAPSLGRYISKTSEKIKPEGLSKTRQVHPGDLILSNSMSFGRPYIMAIEGCIHDGWLLIRDEPKSFDPMYLCHMLGTPKMLNQYRMLASGSTVNNLNKELVSNASILMPCKSEQKVIGQFFNHLDDLITLHQRK
ncbi:restriction endonuclease subunit S, partial [Bifidobacterium bifidum]